MKSAITASLKLIRPSQALTAQVRQAFATNPFDNPYGDKLNKVKSNKNNGPQLSNIGINNPASPSPSASRPASSSQSTHQSQSKAQAHDVLHNVTKDSNQVKAGQFVVNNIGLKNFINRVYQTTGLGFVASLAAAYLGTYIPLLSEMPEATILGGALVSMAAFTGVTYIKPTTITQNVLGSPGTVVTRTQNSASRILLYSIGALGLGISSSPLFAAIKETMPQILPTSIAISLGIFGGASAMAYALPKDSALSYGKVLGGSLLGLIAMQLVGLGSYYFTGSTALSNLLFTIDTYAGIVLFIGFIGYDTHVAIKQYESGNADHLAVSVQLFLDLWNLLIRILQIMAKSKKK